MGESEGQRDLIYLKYQDKYLYIVNIKKKSALLLLASLLPVLL
jgi:hypothetical protein